MSESSAIIGFCGLHVLCMRRIVAIWLFAGVFCTCMYGQKNRARIENIQMDFISNRVEIDYDLVNSNPDRRHEIEFYVLDNRGKVVFPDSLRGDIGPGIAPGPDKKILWDIYQEYDVVHGNFHPKIILDGTGRYGVKGGASNAMFSLLVPGLGDYFVADYRKMKVKPWTRTIATYAFMGMGIAASVNRKDIPALIGEPGYYPRYIMQADGKHLWIDEYRDDYMLEKAYTDYWLFRYDAEVFLGVGITFWLADVIWVARQGIRNGKIKNEIFQDLTLLPARQGMVLSYNYNF